MNGLELYVSKKFEECIMVIILVGSDAYAIICILLSYKLEQLIR